MSPKIDSFGVFGYLHDGSTINGCEASVLPPIGTIPVRKYMEKKKKNAREIKLRKPIRRFILHNANRRTLALAQRGRVCISSEITSTKNCTILTAFSLQCRDKVLTYVNVARDRARRYNGVKSLDIQDG
jgi:hypothetical protein